MDGNVGADLKVGPSHDDTMVAIRYVIANPVRAGLVLRPEAYPFLGSMTGTVSDLLDSMRSDAARADLQVGPDDSSD